MKIFKNDLFYIYQIIIVIDYILICPAGEIENCQNLNDYLNI